MIETSLVCKNLLVVVSMMLPAFYIAVPDFFIVLNIIIIIAFHYIILRGASHFHARTDLVAYNDEDDFRNLVSVWSLVVSAISGHEY